MIKILNKQTNEIYVLHGANKEDADKDSCIVNRPVTNRFRSNWAGVFDYFISLGSSTQCLLDSAHFEILI